MESRHVTPQRNAAAQHPLANVSVLTALVLAGSCMLPAAADAADSDASRGERPGRIDRGGAIYAMTNASNGNEILVFGRDSNGRLHAFSRRRNLA